jgi:hypothetical protein
VSGPFRDAPPSTDAYDAARTSWGFPRFAADFPRQAALDALVVAFARGDYATVRERAPDLTKSDDPAVKRAAEQLLDALAPDPSAKILFGLTAALLVCLFGWWLAHDHPAEKPEPPKVEIVK